MSVTAAVVVVHVVLFVLLSLLLSRYIVTVVDMLLSSPVVVVVVVVVAVVVVPLLCPIPFCHAQRQTSAGRQDFSAVVSSQGQSLNTIISVFPCASVSAAGINKIRTFLNDRQTEPRFALSRRFVVASVVSTSQWADLLG